MGIMSGKKGIIFGVSNKFGIANAIAEQIFKQGGELAFTYANEAMEKRVRPIAESMDAKICLTNMHCTITDVVIDFLDWTNSDYKICRIRYARTAPEQLSFRNIQVKSDMDSIGSTLTEVHDSELDAELDLFR